jgi:hypothetical protein
VRLARPLAEQGVEFGARLRFSDSGRGAGQELLDRDSAVARGSRRFWSTWLELADEIIDRAVARGEAAAPVDPELLLDAIAGPILFRLLLSDEPLDDPFVEHLAQLVSAGATANGSRR